MSNKVYLFATCLGQGIYGKTVLNTINLLKREGVEVIYKKDQTCCGQPGFNSGFFDESRKVALYNMDLFNEDYPILIPSGSCAGMMSHDYVELFKGRKEEQRARDFAKRVYSIAKYLDEVLKVNYEDKGDPIKITWHSNCHDLRIAKTIKNCKNLIAKLKNVELVELEHEEECCGFGGTFAVKEPEISNAMALEKIKDIQNQNVDYVVSADAGCLMNISGTLSRNNSKIKAVHLYDFLWKRLQGEAI